MDQNVKKLFFRFKGRDHKASLLYWARLDYVGCAMFSSPVVQGNMDVSIDTVCMFGSSTSPPRETGELLWEEGYPCTRCARSSCMGDKYKALCGERESLKDAYYRWQSVFWKQTGSK